MTAKELIAAYYSAFNRKDVESLLSLLTDDIRHDINQGSTEIGKDAFRDFMSIMDAHYEEKVLNLVIMEGEKTSRAAAEFTIDGAYKKTQAGLPEAHGQKYQISVGAFFEIKNGKIARVTNYYNLPEWIKQVSK